LPRHGRKLNSWQSKYDAAGIVVAEETDACFVATDRSGVSRNAGTNNHSRTIEHWHWYAYVRRVELLGERIAEKIGQRVERFPVWH
jgi:hypothetical protein